MSSTCRSCVVPSPRAAFEELFGPPLEFWLFDGRQWQHLSSADPPPASGCQNPACRRGARLSPPDIPEKLSDPAVQDIGSGMLSILIPLHRIDLHQPRNHVVWGVVNATIESLAKSLLRVAALHQTAATAAAELQEGLDPHLEQISRDFEELTWLRELNERLFESTVDDPLEAVAQRVLPELRQLITAESIAVVNRSSSSGQPPAVSWCQRQLLSDDQCRRLVEYLDARSTADRPMIVNHLGATDVGEQFPGIDSCLQVPIVRQGIEYGWLLALNRSPEHARSPHVEPSALTHVGHYEFGTEQAGLLYSAAATLASHARNSELCREKENLLINIIKAMINALDAKDPYTCGHSDRVASTARQIGERLGLESRECELLYMSGLLHDIGKIGVPDDVLLKPGKLTKEEFDVIAQHPSIGHAILSHLPQLKAVLPGVLHHHEHLNGRGYPHGLQGHDIPLFGRILAVADAFDAMTTCRPYRTAMPIEKATSILEEGAGTQWDPEIVQAFLGCLPAILQDRASRTEGLQTIFESAAAAGHVSLGERVEAARRGTGCWSSRSAPNSGTIP